MERSQGIAYLPIIMKRRSLSGTIPELSRDFLANLSKIEFLLYLVKCLLGGSICFGLYAFFPHYQFLWSIVSVLLALSPDYQNCIALSVDRIKANVIGALIGLGTFLLRPTDLLSLCGAVLVTILVCTFFRLVNATRPALAALVIVLIQEKERNSWELATQRMVAVAVGSIVALALTLVFHVISTRMTQRSRADESTGADE